MKDLVEMLRQADAGELHLDVYTRLRILEVLAQDRTDTRNERFQNSAFWRKTFELSDIASIQIARSTLRTIVLLNGGGLVAIPPLINLLALDIKTYFWWAFATVITFVLGLSTGWAATFCGYLSLARRTEAARAHLDAAARSVADKYSSERIEMRPTEASIGSLQRAKSKLRAFHFYRVSALVLCALAFALFMVGIVAGLLMILLGAAAVPR